MKVINNKYKLKHEISAIVICGIYMFEFSVSKDVKRRNIRESRR